MIFYEKTRHLKPKIASASGSLFGNASAASTTPAAPTSGGLFGNAVAKPAATAAPSTGGKIHYFKYAKF